MDHGSTSRQNSPQDEKQIVAGSANTTGWCISQTFFSLVLVAAGYNGERDADWLPRVVAVSRGVGARGMSCISAV